MIKDNSKLRSDITVLEEKVTQTMKLFNDLEKQMSELRVRVEHSEERHDYLYKAFEDIEDESKLIKEMFEICDNCEYYFKNEAELTKHNQEN